MSIFLSFLCDDIGWTLGELLFNLFNFGDDVECSGTHTQVVSAFLRGACIYKPACILDLWMRHPFAASKKPSDKARLFSLAPKDLRKVESAHAALTCFAAQAVSKQLIKEADHAIKPTSGLHAARKRTKAESEGEKTRIHWQDIGAVVTNSISSLLFSRSNRANLLPMAHGLLHFALQAPYDLYLVQSRLGNTPAYSTVLRMLDKLAQEEAQAVRAHGQDPTTVASLISDNIQHQHVQRDLRVGRVNKMNIGMAATYVEAQDCPVTALDYDDKMRRVAANERSRLTVPQLIGFIDQSHRQTIGVLFLLRVLVNTIPELSIYKSEVSLRYRTRAAKLRREAAPSKVHPLGTSAKNETVTTELKDALVDFLEQAGQTRERYNKQLFLCIGDGLTYEKTVQIKNYLRFHPDPFESFRIIEPVLAPWHTVWTDLSRIFDTHWDSLLSKDPSTLGFAAAKIGRRAPSSLKKPDFNYAFSLLEIVHDAHVMDCWRIHFKMSDVFKHFTDLATQKKLPSFEELETAAGKIHHAYCTQHASERALNPVGDIAEQDEHPNTRKWKESIPAGTVWSPPSSTVQDASAMAVQSASSPTVPAKTSSTPQHASESSAVPSGNTEDMMVPSSNSGNPKAKQKTEQPPPPFLGDRVLANAINFMNDAIICREFLYAVAEGDVGRVYEAMKMMLFTFAGSSHSKYTGYLLEFISVLELESSRELRETILKSLVVNLTGEPGRFAPADLIQEYFNRLLQAIAERKGVEYNTHFIRDIVARNLHHLARQRDDMKEGLGLSERSGRHGEPQTRVELGILMDAFERLELHHRQSGRTFACSPTANHRVSDFRRGVAALRDVKLPKWVKESTFMRGTSLPAGSTTGDDEGIDDETSPETELEPPSLHSPVTLPCMCVVDGELILEVLDVEAEAQSIVDGLDSGCIPEEGDSVDSEHEDGVSTDTYELL
ncbi:hypothetical protein LXA43DRAFT_902933 [Ganoderma leucocontextum]|nr:hypothetical protein LXA43DRAFT_902933 [Ganoderma leucocontextum]